MCVSGTALKQPALYNLNGCLLLACACVCLVATASSPAPPSQPPTLLPLLPRPTYLPTYLCPALPSHTQVKRGVLYTWHEAEGKRLKNPFDTITEGVGLNRLTANFAAAAVDDAVKVTDREAVEMAAYLLRCVCVCVVCVLGGRRKESMVRLGGAGIEDKRDGLDVAAADESSHWWMQQLGSGCVLPHLLLWLAVLRVLSAGMMACLLAARRLSIVLAQSRQPGRWGLVTLLSQFCAMGVLDTSASSTVLLTFRRLTSHLRLQGQPWTGWAATAADHDGGDVGDVTAVEVCIAIRCVCVCVFLCVRMCLCVGRLSMPRDPYWTLRSHCQCNLPARGIRCQGLCASTDECQQHCRALNMAMCCKPTMCAL